MGLAVWMRLVNCLTVWMRLVCGVNLVDETGVWGYLCG